MYKGYRVRLFPTPEQEEKLWKHINACRFMWNYMLNYKEQKYAEGVVFISKYDMMKVITPLRKTEGYTWLQEINIHSLQNVCVDLDQAYKDFFKKLRKHPKFKSKRTARKSYPVDCGRCRFKGEDIILIPSVGKVKCRTTTKNHDKLSHIRICYVNNKWILSYGAECESQALSLSNDAMGIDLGIKEMAVVAFGDRKIVYHNINKSQRMRKLEKKRSHIKRVIDRKYRTNKSYEKTKAILKYENILRNVYRKITCIKDNRIHQVTHELIMMLPKTIVMENINVTDMKKTKYLAKAVEDQCFYKFISTMEYKAKFYGIEFVKADRYYASSKICSNCGHKKKHIRLNERVYTCEKCGYETDRDYNAAINLMRYVDHKGRSTA